ncbi:MAG TPA: DUF3567 domain-containing protein [Rhizobacter sp.]|nr:DUF3567 domain-containing protein [Rhizobacter sp.]
MQMLYNSDNFAVVQIDLPAIADIHLRAAGQDALARGGYEIIDKFARKEIFIEGAMAESFRHDVAALVETSPSEEEMDDFIERYTALMQHPLIFH